MGRSTLTSEDVARRGKDLYQQSIREKVETPENIGKMVIIDVETGDYAVDETGLESARKLHTRHSDAALYGIRIGYNVAESLGGVMERVGS